MAAESQLSSVQSPCRSLCKLGVDKVCVGCYRTSSEINFWTTMSDEQKLEVIDKAQKREQSRLA